MTSTDVPVRATGGPLIPPTNTAAASWALFTGVAFLMLGNGLQGTVLGIRSELEGFTTSVSGAIMASYFVGFLAGSRSVTRALQVVGHIRVFAALASMASAATLVHALAVHPVSWGLMRFTTGLCMAGLYVVAESWINDLATNATRGRLLAVYMVVAMGGLAGGQFLVNLADPGGTELFIIASVLVSLSLVPVVMSGRGAPPAVFAEPMSIAELIRTAPTGPTVATLIGVAHGALIGMGAFYATRAGLSVGRVAVFMGAPMVGGMLLQLPIGSLSDRVPRRGVMVAVALTATATSIGLLLVPAGSLASIGLMFLLGGCSFPLYSLGIAFTNDWLRTEQFTGAAASLVTMNGIGAILGPVVAAGLMVALGNQMFFVALIASHGLIAGYLIFRVIVRDGLPLSRQRRFIPLPARASATAVAMLSRRRR